MKALHFWLAALCFVLLQTACLKENGCTNPLASNYNPDAVGDGGNCEYTAGLAQAGAYSFTRLGENTVDHAAQTVAQLLINDLALAIGLLGETGTEPLTTDFLMQYLQVPSPDLEILTPIGEGSALAGAYSDIEEGVVLQELVNDAFGTNALLAHWLDTIAQRSQNALLLGSPDVFTIKGGLDLQQQTYISLLAGVCFANAIGLLENIAGFDNEAAETGTYRTEMAHAWDAAYGYFGATANYPDFAPGTLAAPDARCSDSNADGFVNYGAECNYGYAVLANERDGAGLGTDFSGRIFGAFWQGRVAIGKRETENIGNQVGEIQNAWRATIAATALHHLNGLKQRMTQLGSPPLNDAELNRHWSAVKAHYESLQFDAGNPLANELATILELLGKTPVYATPGTPGFEEYWQNLLIIADLTRLAHSFTVAQMDGF